SADAGTGDTGVGCFADETGCDRQGVAERGNPRAGAGGAGLRGLVQDYCEDQGQDQVQERRTGVSVPHKPRQKRRSTQALRYTRSAWGRAVLRLEEKQGVLTENLWPKLFSEAPRCAPLRLALNSASDLPSVNRSK